MNRAFSALGLLLWLGVSGCSTVRPGDALNLPPEKWAFELRKRGVDPEEVPQPMLVTPEIREIANRLGGGGGDQDALRRLQLALLDSKDFTFEYDRIASYTAAETLAKRRGNCVSFTNLFIALARALGRPAQAALLTKRGESSRFEDLVVVYGHMVAALPKGANATVYDFYQQRQETRGQLLLIDDIEVAAISASNWGVEALKNGNLERARQLLETAVKLSPQLPDIYGNLGLVRWKSGDRKGAFEAFQTGLSLDKQRPSILNNVASIYLEMGRREDARAALAAANHGMASPYFLLAYGDIEFARGHVAEALKFYRRAHRQNSKLVEPLLAIARAEQKLGNEKAATKALDKASKLIAAEGGEALAKDTP
jgi:Flp pilus assembly protein TadD